jgi:hypothetical protein
MGDCLSFRRLPGSGGEYLRQLLPASVALGRQLRQHFVGIDDLHPSLWQIPSGGQKQPNGRFGQEGGIVEDHG